MTIHGTWRLSLSYFLCPWNRRRNADKSIIAVLTEYHTKTTYQREFVDALSAYVTSSLSAGGNIMSETYYEKGDFCIMWVIERWRNYNFYRKHKRSREARMIKTLAKTGLTYPPETTYLEDLLSLSNKPSVNSKANDQPVTIMLIVDVKTGTDNHFRSINRSVLSAFRNEPGVLLFRLSRALYRRNRFIVCKKFRDWDAFQYHLKDPVVQPVITFLQTSVKEPPYEKGYHHLIQFAPPHSDF